MRRPCAQAPSAPRSDMSHAGVRRALLISPGYPPPFVGGSKVYIYNMTLHCAVPLDILTGQLRHGDAEIHNAPHRIVRKRWIWNDPKDPSTARLVVSYVYALAWWLRAQLTRRYSVVIVNGETVMNGMFFIAGRLLGVPVIGVGYGEEFSMIAMRHDRKHRIKKWLLDRTHRYASGFITVCDFCNPWLERQGIPAVQLTVIPPSLARDKIAATVPGRKPGRSVLSVGRLVERKGFHTLIDAAAVLRTEFPDLKVTIVGDGPLRRTLEEQVERLGLDDTVNLAGGVADAALQALYAESNIFVLAHRMMPDGNTEGCPTVFAEAGAYGLPVLGGNNSGALTIIEHGSTGYVLDMSKLDELVGALRGLLADPLKAQIMGAAGRAKILRDHLPESVGPMLQRVIERAAARRPLAGGHTKSSAEAAGL